MAMTDEERVRREIEQYWLDFDWRVAKRVGCPAHFLGSGHPIPTWQPLPPKREPKKESL
jgi:hypothetical protein